MPCAFIFHGLAALNLATTPSWLVGIDEACDL